MFNVRTRQMLFSALAAFSMQVASFQMVATASEGQATMPWSEATAPAPGGIAVIVQPSSLDTALALARSQRWLVLVLAADEAQRQSFRDQAQAAKLAGFDDHWLATRTVTAGRPDGECGFTRRRCDGQRGRAEPCAGTRVRSGLPSAGGSLAGRIAGCPDA